MNEKIIELDIMSKEDLYEKYNQKVVSKEIINYLVEKLDPFTKEKVKIVINNHTKEDTIELIKEGLELEYEMKLSEKEHNDLRQLIFLLIGVILLFISTILNKIVVFNEILLIGGWVLIWETIEIEIFTDSEIKRRRLILKKLLSSEFIVK